MNRLSDLRNAPATLDEAAAMFNRLAKDTITLEAKTAALEKRIAALKAAHEADTAQLAGDITIVSNELTKFIERNRSLFQSPRKIKTSFGSFGLQTVSALVISDRDKLEECVFEKGYDDCFRCASILVKPAIKARIEAGEKLPGCSIKAGDTAVYKVDRALIQRARETEEGE